MDAVISILTIIISFLSGIFGTIIFFKANKKKANAEATNTEINNLDAMQKIYQEIIFDQKKEMNELRERIKELEVKMKDFCINCKYKRYYEENN